MARRKPLSFGIKTGQRYTTHNALLDVWQEAENFPVFEHAWLNDHFMGLGSTPPGPYLESWTLLAALAAQTQRLRIGVMVTDNTYRQPAVLAKMAATVDVVSHGRLNFGIGTGWSEQQHRAYGIPLPTPGERVRRLGEACELIRRLWSEPTVTFEGRYYQLHEAPCDPKPVQKPCPPFAIGGEGEQTLQVIARYADIWDCSVATPDIYAHKRIFLERLCTAIGRDSTTIAYSRHISVDPTDLKATLAETRAFLDVGAMHIIYHVPVPASGNILRRLAEEVALPLQAEYQ
ncbi:MAG TPA: TIGR03560 family F420-dependent LLM class oxidoreductase [Ktedonobacteraceae bacterium]|jgi:F420-dependent oxidoreductase-like protein|nr:TIGR03560 family F420-dependent LLM class oxidoreductase [Ktedonobacteraceae bacterium]